MSKEVLFEDIVKNTNYSNDYLKKIFRKYNIRNKILLLEEDIIEILSKLKNDINTQKKYNLYIYLKRKIT